MKNLAAIQSWSLENLKLVRNDTAIMCDQAQRRLDSLEGARAVLDELIARERSAVDEYQRAGTELLTEIRRREACTERPEAKIQVSR